MPRAKDEPKTVAVTNQGATNNLLTTIVMVFEKTHFFFFFFQKIPIWSFRGLNPNPSLSKFVKVWGALWGE